MYISVWSLVLLLFIVELVHHQIKEERYRDKDQS